MASQSEILKFEMGVTLKKVSLYQGNSIIDSQYVVSTKRTPEVRDFSLLEKAEEHFANELKLVKNVL